MRHCVVSLSLFLILASASAAHAQTSQLSKQGPAGIGAKILTISYVTFDRDSHESGIKEFFNLLFNCLRQEDTLFASSYSEWTFSGVKYTHPPPNTLHDTIAILTPLKYAEFKDYYPKQLHPILIARKGSMRLPYYSAVAVASGDSSITSLMSPAIQNVYMLEDGSLSGNAAPLTLFWQMRMINRPTMSELEKLPWKITRVNSHDKVLQAVARNSSSIGFTWTRSDLDDWYVKTVVRYGCYPQDVVCISEELQPFQSTISRLMTKLAEDRADETAGASLNRPPLDIRGFVNWDTEYENATEHVAMMRRRILTVSPSAISGLFLVFFSTSCLCLVFRLFEDKQLRTDSAILVRLWRAVTLLVGSLIDSALWLVMLWLVSFVRGIDVLLRPLLQETPTDRITFALIAGSGAVLGVVIASIPVARRIRESAFNWVARWFGDNDGGKVV